MRATSQALHIFCSAARSPYTTTYVLFLLRLAVCCSHASWWLEVYNSNGSKNKPDVLPVMDLCNIAHACRSMADYSQLAAFAEFSLCCRSFLDSSSASFYSLPALTPPLSEYLCPPPPALSFWPHPIVRCKTLISASLSLVSFFCSAVSRTASCWKYVSPLQRP